MPESHVIGELVARLEGVVREQGGSHVTRIRVRLGALSRLTPESFREGFAAASRGTVAEGAAVEVELDGDTAAAGAQGVFLETVEAELPAEG